ncbi:Hcp family type VI secretion system effector [Arenibaculum pallidiluteum]|uniref:Hcp family type VI secretion system effector n=1 Tax=Arenibaculum pallidiluteum TaxID=2812559 RepID=UPI001A96428E|nr:type VI secretion system tube protein Hcp [Arenibaculum pallidiluteum]
MSQVILEIPGVNGECALKDYKDMILCESLSHDLELEIEMSTNARRTVSTAKINNIALERKWDAASVHLIRRLLRGTAQKEPDKPWIIHCLKALGGENQYVEFLTMKLTHAILAKHSLNVNEGDTTESIEINATKIEWIYAPHDASNTNPGKHTAEYDSLQGTVG